MAKKALTTQPNAIVSQLVARIGEEDLTLPTDSKELWSLVENSEAYACLYQVKAGLAYKALKVQLPHGEFEKGLKTRDIPPRRARERIAVAEFVLNCPALNANACSHLKEKKSNRRTSADLESEQTINLESFNFSQLNELTRLPEEKIQQIEPDELEELSKLPARALKATVKQINFDFDQQHKLEAENANLKKTTAELNNQLAEAINELGHEKLKKAPEALFGLPPLVAHIKQEAPQVSQQLHEYSLQVVNLVERVIVPGLDQEQAEMAAAAIYHWVTAPMMQLSTALNRLKDHFGEAVIHEDAPLPSYGENEWLEAEQRRQAIVSFHQGAKKQRKGRK